MEETKCQSRADQKETSAAANVSKSQLLYSDARNSCCFEEHAETAKMSPEEQRWPQRRTQEQLLQSAVSWRVCGLLSLRCSCGRSDDAS